LSADPNISVTNSTGTNTFNGGIYKWERNLSVAGASGLAVVGRAGTDYDQIIIDGDPSASDLSGIQVKLNGGNVTAASFARDQVRAAGAADPTKRLVFNQIIASRGNFASSNIPKFNGPNTAVIKISLAHSTDPNQPGIDLVVDRKSYGEFAQNRNGAAFGAYLDKQLASKYEIVGDKVGALLHELDAYSTDSEVALRLRDINPTSAYATMFSVNVKRALAMSSVIDDHLDTIAAESAMSSSLKLGASLSPTMLTPTGGVAGSEKRFTAWVSGYASRSSLDASAAYGSSHANDNGGMLGLETRIGDLTLGAVAATGQGSANFENPSVKVDSDHVTVGGYSSVNIGGVVVDGTALWTTSDDKSSRTGVTASYNSSGVQLGIGVSANLLSPKSGWQVSPVARVKYVDYSQDAFDEVGAGLPFRFGKLTGKTVLTKLGVKVGHQTALTNDVGLSLDGGAYWVHDLVSAGRGLNSGMNGADGMFRAYGRKSGADSAQLNLGVQATFSEAWAVRLSGQQDASSNHSETSGVFSVSLNF
jgi:outer membrane autotransporter protein